MNLYDLCPELDAIDAMFEQSEGELTPQIENALAAYSENRNKSIDGLCYVIRNREARAKARKDEADRFAKLAKADANTADRLKRYLLGWLQNSGLEKVETEKFAVRVQQNGRPAFVVEIPYEDLPERFTREKLEVDGNALYDAWKAGENLPIGVQVEVGSHLRIR